MSVEQVGPGGVSNSYGVRGTSAKQEYDNDKEYKEVFVPKDTIPLTATVSSSGEVRFLGARSSGRAVNYARDAGFKPLGEVVPLNGASWTRVANSSAASVITTNPQPGYSVRLTTDNAATAYVAGRIQVQPFRLDNNLFNFEVDIREANNNRSLRLTLINDSGETIKAVLNSGQNWHPGRNVISCKIDDFTFTGADKTTQWNYIRFDLTTSAIAPTQLNVDIGRMWVGGGARVPCVVIGCDGGNEKVYDWLYPAAKAQGFPCNVFAWTLAVGQAGKMTLDEYREVYAAGWDIGMYYGNYGANSHNLTGIATAQSVAAGGAFTINGAYASGGVAVLDEARTITVCLPSGTEASNAFVVTGTDANGAAITETLIGTVYPLKAYSSKKFKTVSSVTAVAATTVAVSIGTGFTANDMIAAFNAQKPWLDQNGFTRGALNFALPLGEHNYDTEMWLKAVGMKTARTTHTAVTMHREMNRALPINQHFLSCAVTLGDPGSDTVVKAGVQKAIDRGLDITILAHLGGGVTPDQAVLGTTMAWLGDLHRSGVIRVVSYSEYEEIYGL